MPADRNRYNVDPPKSETFDRKSFNQGFENFIQNASLLPKNKVYASSDFKMKFLFLITYTGGS